MFIKEGESLWNDIPNGFATGLISRDKDIVKALRLFADIIERFNPEIELFMWPSIYFKDYEWNIHCTVKKK